MVRTNLNALNIGVAEDRETALVRALASVNILVAFERTNGTIWGSQVAMLRYLNGLAQGCGVSDVRPFYDAAKAEYPAWYENYSFEQWLEFLCGSILIVRDHDHIQISVRGREYLKYLITLGRQAPFYG